MESASTVTSQPISVPASSDKHPLSLPYFRNFWIARTVSVFGDQFYIVALPWIVLQLTSSGLALGTILMIGAIPRAVLMLVGGVVTDRFSPRRVLMATAAIRTLLVGTMATLISLRLLQLWEVYLLTFAFGVTDAFSLPAAGALLPRLVKPEQLQVANSLTQSSQTLTELIGPGSAGLIIRLWGSATAMALDALSFVPMIVALFRLPEPQIEPVPAQAARRKTLHSIQEGLRAVHSDRPLLWLILLFATINICISGPIGVGLAVLAKFQFGSATALGTIFTCISVGALTGTILGGVVKKPRKRGLLIVMMSILIGLEMIAIGLILKFVAIAILLVLMGLGAGFINVIVASWIQTRAEPAIMGRVMSVLMLSTLGLTPLSLAIAGVLALWSLTGMFVIAGSVLAIISAIMGTSKASRSID